MCALIYVIKKLKYIAECDKIDSFQAINWLIKYVCMDYLVIESDSFLKPDHIMHGDFRK